MVHFKHKEMFIFVYIFELQIIHMNVALTLQVHVLTTEISEQLVIVPKELVKQFLKY